MASNIPQICALIGLCCLVLFVILIAFDIIIKLRYLCSNNKDGWSDSTTTDIRIMIYSNLVVILVHIVSTSLNLFLSSDDAFCQIMTKISTLSFDVSRAVLYMILVRRTAIIFEDTVFGLNKVHKYLFYAFIAFICVYSVPYIIYIHLTSIQCKYNPKYGCLVQYTPSILMYTSSALHIFIIMYSLYLFINPLYKLISHQTNDRICSQLYRVMIKYVILHCTSICSCILLMVLSYLFPFGYNYSVIDACINGVILILLHPLQNRVYKVLCCLFNSFCLMICNVSSDAIEPSETKVRKPVKSPAVHPVNAHNSPSPPKPITPKTTCPDTPVMRETNEAVIKSLPSDFKIVIDPNEMVQVLDKSPGDTDLNVSAENAYEDMEQMNSFREIEMGAFNTNHTNTSSRARMSQISSLNLSPSTTLKYTPSNDGMLHLKLQTSLSNTLKLIKFESYQL
eukprot:40805_1